MLFNLIDWKTPSKDAPVNPTITRHDSKYIIKTARIEFTLILFIDKIIFIIEKIKNKTITSIIFNPHL